MSNYLRGEIYRVLHKKSLYIFIGIVAVGYILLALVRLGSMETDKVLSDAESLFFLLPAVIGGFLFATLYTDDLNSKNLTMLIGFGIGKAKIVFSKFILMGLFSGIIFGLTPLFMSGVYTVLGHPPSAATIGVVYAWALKIFLTTLVFAALSAIVVYGLQRPTFGMVAYLLLTLNVVGQLLVLVLSIKPLSDLAPHLSDHLVSSVLGKILGGMLDGTAMGGPLVEYLLYLALALVASVVAFRKKELEF
ncbi:MAG: hypothetical protein LBL36_00025 [Clostridiales Family XIII bacterium]|jgi:ABC-type transport system involved in multi-copper enzyme maturation permease subunit|nr:hypothetical protein [Clostridiales Family XIII bacterium]